MIGWSILCRSQLQEIDRHIPNTMPDYDTFISQLALNHSPQLGTSRDGNDTPLTFKASSCYHKLQQETKTWILKHVKLIQHMFPPESQSAPISVGKSRNDSSIYVGCGGNAYLHWRLARFFEAEGDPEKAVFHRKSAETAVNVALSMLPKRYDRGDEIAFYIGSAGMLC